VDVPPVVGENGLTARRSETLVDHTSKHGTKGERDHTGGGVRECVCVCVCVCVFSLWKSCMLVRLIRGEGRGPR